MADLLRQRGVDADLGFATQPLGALRRDQHLAWRDIGRRPARHAAHGDIDDRRGYERIPFEVKVSETGINVDEAAQIGGAIIGKQKESEELANIIALFQMGPRTGNPVYNERYAEDILERLRQKELFLV